MKRTLLLATQAVVTVVLLWFLLRDFDWVAVPALILQLPLWFYLLSLVVVLGGQILYAWRWRVVLVSAGVTLPFLQVLEQYFIGIFLNCFGPASLGGDAAKVYYLGKRHGYRTVTATVVLDRIFGLGFLAVVALLALSVSAVDIPGAGNTRAWIVLVVAGMALVLGGTATGTGGLPRRVTPLGPWAVRMATHLQDLRLRIAPAAADPRVLLHAGGVVLVYFVALTAVYDIYIRLQIGHFVAFAPLMMAAAAIAMLTSVPVALNGLGLREQMHILFLGPLGVPKGEAVALSLLVFAHLMLGSVIGGLLWLRLRSFGGLERTGV